MFPIPPPLAEQYNRQSAVTRCALIAQDHRHALVSPVLLPTYTLVWLALNRDRFTTQEQTTERERTTN